MRFAAVVIALTFVLAAGLWCSPARGQQDPYGNFIARNDPRTPAETIKATQLPKGYHLETVLAEPDIKEPVAIAGKLTFCIPDSVSVGPASTVKVAVFEPCAL